MNPDPVICGLDPSSDKLTVVLGPLGADVDDLQVMVRRLGAQRDPVTKSVAAFEWTDDVVAAAHEFRERDSEVWVGVEKPVLGRGGANATIPQSIVHGALLAGFGRERLVPVTVLQVHNASWKKQVVGNGGAKKEAIAEWVQRHHPGYVERTRLRNGNVDQDAMDALCIWFSVCQTYRVRQRMDIGRTKVRRERIGGRA